MADLRALEVDPPAAVERCLQLAQARGADGAVALAVGERLPRHGQATGAPVRHPVAQQALGLVRTNGVSRPTAQHVEARQLEQQPPCSPPTPKIDSGGVSPGILSERRDARAWSATGRAHETAQEKASTLADVRLGARVRAA